MSINLPHWLAEVVNVLGFNWPEIDEDQIREAGHALRRYADGAAESSGLTSTRIADLSRDYQGQSYQALVQVWSHQSHSHMQTLIEGCHLLAGGMDLAADGVVAMKGKVIVQLGIAAGEVIADQAAAVATLGLAEAALPALIAAQNRVLNGILAEFEDQVIGELLTRTLAPVRERVDAAVNTLVYAELSAAVSPSAGERLLVDHHALREHARHIDEQAEANQRAGWDLHTRLSRLQFTTGG